MLSCKSSSVRGSRSCTLTFERAQLINIPVQLLGPFLSKGTPIAQANSGSDSESRRQNEETIPVNRLTATVWAEPPAGACHHYTHLHC
jgi:hypothetical protein